MAHINGDRTDSRFENLVWLCLEHHDEYDSTTSQSKGLTPQEVRHYRDELYKLLSTDETIQRVGDPARDQLVELEPLPHTPEYDVTRSRCPKKLAFTERPWRFPLWQAANLPEYFAYRSANGADGICLIERIDLPDGRIVVACIETVGNPGMSITNSVEELCFQVCDRFEIAADRLVWLEHYDYLGPTEWDMVTFATAPPEGLFSGPTWIPGTAELWEELRLRPKKRLIRRHNRYESKLIKLFDWPTEALL